MTTTSQTTTNWFKGLRKTQPLLEESKNNFDYTTYWLGRSCGARLHTPFTEIPLMKTGIVVYPGIRFTERKEDTKRVINWVNTKNGPLTVVSDIKHLTKMVG